MARSRKKTKKIPNAVNWRPGDVKSFHGGGKESAEKEGKTKMAAGQQGSRAGGQQGRRAAGVEGRGAAGQQGRGATRWGAGGRQGKRTRAKSARELLSANLLKLKKRKGMRGIAVAAVLGVSRSTWSQWEKGTRFPTGEMLGNLARCFGIPVCQLFDDGTCHLACSRNVDKMPVDG